MVVSGEWRLPCKGLSLSDAQSAGVAQDVVAQKITREQRAQRPSDVVVREVGRRGQAGDWTQKDGLSVNQKAWLIISFGKRDCEHRVYSLGPDADGRNTSSCWLKGCPSMTW